MNEQTEDGRYLVKLNRTDREAITMSNGQEPRTYRFIPQPEEEEKFYQHPSAPSEEGNLKE